MSKKLFQNQIGFIVILSFFSLGGISEFIQIQTFENYSRLIFKIENTVPREFKANPKGFEIFFQNLSLQCFDIFFHQKKTWKKYFSPLEHSRLQEIQCSQTDHGVVIQGKWRFSSTLQTSLPLQMEYFEYYEKKAHHYRVDFWWKKEKPFITKAQTKKPLTVQNIQKFQNPLPQNKENFQKKDPSSMHLQTLPFHQKIDFSLKFHPIHTSFNFKEWLPDLTADQNFEYRLPQIQDPEFQYVQKILDFYHIGKFGLAIRAIEFLFQYYPNTAYQFEMLFLKANAFIKLGYPQLGEKKLKSLTTKIKYSQISLHAKMYLAYQNFKRENYLDALYYFYSLIENFKDQSRNWIFHLGAAECLYHLKQFSQSAQHYQWITENAPKKSWKAEAAYRYADPIMAQFQYEQALIGYSKAQRYFKKFSKKYPDFFLNQGEVLYQLKLDDQAKKIFYYFLENYPYHSEGWRATFRLGEIITRHSKNEKNIKESMHWFHQTINHYSCSSSKILSILRILPHENSFGFNFSTQNLFFKNHAKKYQGENKVLLKEYPDFLALSRIKSLIQFGNDQAIVNTSLEEISKVKSEKMKIYLNHAVYHFLRETILKLINSNKKNLALRFFIEKSSQIPPIKNNKDINFYYLIQLSKIALDFQFQHLAHELLKNYQSILKKQTHSEKEKIPKDSEYYFIKSRLKWFHYLKNPSQEISEKIEKKLNHIPKNSQFNDPKILMLSKIKENNKAFQESIDYLSNIHSPNIHSNYWIAQLYKKNKNLEKALEYYKKVESQLDPQIKKENTPLKTSSPITIEIGLHSIPAYSQLIFKQTKIFENKLDWKNASAVYSRALKNTTHAKLQYHYARSLIHQKSFKKYSEAIKILKNLITHFQNDSKEKFWVNLAQEVLESEISQPTVKEEIK